MVIVKNCNYKMKKKKKEEKVGYNNLKKGEEKEGKGLRPRSSMLSSCSGDKA